MQLMNRKCNSLTCIIGLFCHSTSTLELLIEMLMHASLSISLTTIHDMINSLSQKAHENLKHMSKSLLASFVYDNFDMDFKSWVPTVEKLGSTMTHVTSVLAFPLAHSMTADDLKCSSELWATSHNSLAAEDRVKCPQCSWMHTAQAIHHSLTPAASSSSTDTPHSVPVRDTIMLQLVWHFCSALVTFLAPFNSMWQKLGMPKSQLQIPITKTIQVPC